MSKKKIKLYSLDTSPEFAEVDLEKIELKEQPIFTIRNSDNAISGELFENKYGELVFEGIVSESAEVLFRELIKENNQWVGTMKKGLNQIVQFSTDPEAKRIASNILSGDH